MEKASRANKKQPAFDPSEIKDLIFSPAVGTGVGSHLVGQSKEFPALPWEPQETTQDKSTVVELNSPTVDTLSLPTVTTSNGARSSDISSGRSILADMQALPDQEPRAELAKTTVVITDMTTVVLMTSNPSALAEQATTGETIHMPTVGDTVSATVDMSQRPRYSAALPQSTGEQSGLHEHLTGHEYPEAGREAPHGESASDAVAATVDITDMSTVQMGPPLLRSPKDVALWITEHGDLVQEGRVKRIRLAQDVINSAEESVYDTLWTAKALRTDNNDTSKIVQAGYDYLVKRTRLSKKTIQRIVAKLIDKDFIAIERPPNIYQRTSTVYRVFGYKAVLDSHIQRGRSHVAKMGPGFSYVRPIDDPRLSPQSSQVPSVANAARPPHLSTVNLSHTPTVVSTGVSNLSNQTTDSVVRSDPSTLVREYTTVKGRDDLDNTRASLSTGIYQALSQYGAVDDDIIHRVIRNCREQSADCTEEDIIHFIHEKGSLVRVRDSRIYSPIGFLLTAVPKCFGGEAFRLYREEQRKRQEVEAAQEAARQAELEEWRREQEAQLADPSVSEDDKQFIRQCLGLR